MSESELDSLYVDARQGNQAARELLFERLAARFRHFVRREVRSTADAEDIVQEALLAISAKYDTVALHKEFSSWAYGVLRNKLMDYGRSEQRLNRQTISYDLVGYVPARTNPIDPLFRQKLMQCLAMIARGNKRYAQILGLHYQGFNTEEICGKMDLTRSNFYSILCRGRAMLAECLRSRGLSDGTF
jgi:RNA polymerase sigma-70 factor (ECF subfamily)